MTSKPTPKVAILLGSDSDIPQVEAGLKVLESFGIAYDLRILSAHRTPDEVRELVSGAEAAGYGVIIAGAGGAAHLAGVCASLTALPVIGIPFEAGSMKGLDALFATVNMPPGVPVATVSMGSWGGINAAALAARILAGAFPELRKKVKDYMQKQTEKVLEKDKNARRSFTP